MNVSKRERQVVVPVDEIDVQYGEDRLNIKIGTDEKIWVWCGWRNDVHGIWVNRNVVFEAINNVITKAFREEEARTRPKKTKSAR